MYVEEKSIEKENVCFEEARRESIKENERKAVDMSQDVCIRSLSTPQCNPSPGCGNTVRILAVLTRLLTSTFNRQNRTIIITEPRYCPHRCRKCQLPDLL